jgi:hypothetical protein
MCRVLQFERKGRQTIRRTDTVESPGEETDSRTHGSMTRKQSEYSNVDRYETIEMTWAIAQKAKV